MLVLGWLIIGLISGLMFHGLLEDASRPSCGPPRWGLPRRASITSSTCAPAPPGPTGPPAWKQERNAPWRHMPPTRKLRTPRRDTETIRQPTERGQRLAPADVWRVTR